MLKPLLLFIGVRCTTALIISKLLPLHDGRPLNETFIDLALYNGSANPHLPFWAIPNPFYAVLVNWLGYGHEQLQDFLYIGLSLALNLACTSCFVWIAHRVMRNRSALIYSVVLGAHPYLALYSLKIDTSVFALLPVGLLAASVLASASGVDAFLASAFGSLFRNSLLPMAWLQMIFSRRALYSSAGFVGLILLVASTTLQISYGVAYIGQNYGCYSLGNIAAWFASLGFPERLSSLLSVLVTPVVHILLDLGAREAVANHCLMLPANLARQQWLHLTGTFFFVSLHSSLICRQLIFVRQLSPLRPGVIQLLFPLSMFLPTLYGAAHMRYLVPVIPLLLIFAFEVKSVEKVSRS